MRLIAILKSLLCCLVVLGAAAPAFAAPLSGIVVTIKPLHSLVQGVMGETGEATLLVPGAASVHGFSLKPSQVRALQEARAVIYIDESFEDFLKNALLSLPESTLRLPLARAAGVALLPRRAGGAWQDHHHAHGHDDDDGHDHNHGHSEKTSAEATGSLIGYNLHIWLDPENAIRMTEAITATLSALYPENAAIYAANAARQIAQLDALDRTLRARLDAVRGVPFVVLHDAYPYLEARYGLNAVGALTIEPDAPASAKTLADIRERLRKSGARCLFREPQFSDRLLTTAAEGLAVDIGVLDPLGADIEPGDALYAGVMTRLADSLVACLSR